MANASGPSNYEIFSITKDDREIDLRGKTTSFDYYESVLSPNITGTMTFVDTGSSIKYKESYDPQQRMGGVWNALPLSGGEKVKFKIASKLGTLDFSTDEKAFLVSTAVNPDQESQREAVILSLFSQSAQKNQESKVYEKRSGNIGDIVTQLVKQHLNVDIFAADKTKNSYSFIGNSSNIFDVALWLASKSEPAKGLAGYFFYETRDGFNFKSIDNLISQDPVEPVSYMKTAILKSNLDNDANDYKILKSTITKNQNLVDALKAGVFKLRCIYWNPYSFEEEEIVHTFGKDLELVESLGKDAEAPVVKEFTRSHYDILDVGTLIPSGKGGEKIENDPHDHQAQSTLRYNLLFSQVLNIQVPCNPKLKAGDTIKCDFEIITMDKKVQGSPDPVQSGKYLIVDLCHHFDPTRSVTSMTLVRDSYGLYSKNS